MILPLSVFSGRGVVIFFIVLGVLVALPLLLNLFIRYVYMPLHLWRTQRMARQPQWRETRVDELTPEALDFTGAAVRGFVTEGFEAANNLTISGAVHGVNLSVQVLLVDRRSNDMATVIATLAGSIRSMLLAVRSEFADGTYIVTAAWPDLSAFPRDPAAQGENFPWVRDPRVLAEAHRRRMAKLGLASRPRVAPAPGEELAYVQRDWTTSMERYVRQGYHRSDSKTGDYRLTLKGAVLSCYKLTEPIVSIRRWLRDRRAKRVWREIGMEGWMPAERSAAIGAPAAAAPPSFPEPTGGAPLGLGYELTLAENEIRIESAGGTVTGRVGNADRLTVLRRHWWTLLWMMIVLAATAYWFHIYWQMRGMIARFPPAVRPRLFPSFWFFLGLFFLLTDGIKLFLNLLKARGTTVLAASPAGLTYQNAPAVRGAGEVARYELASLMVLPHETAIRKRFRTHKLEARLQGGGSKRRLALSNDLEGLNRLRQELAVAMGIERAAAPEAAENDPSTDRTSAPGVAGG